MYIKVRVQWTYNDIHNNHYLDGPLMELKF